MDAFNWRGREGGKEREGEGRRERERERGRRKEGREREGGRQDRLLIKAFSDHKKQATFNISTKKKV